ncbi:MAG TPA: XdhC family protein [Ktedonobacteraceae bacterium]|nr:XdhC family protein [Ktedonobacteraceae bacterium]
MSKSLLELAYRLEQAGEPYVLATVIWCERPTSAKPGAQAIIQANGQMTGWIGGNCAQPVVVREALRAMREGDDPYLLRLGDPGVGVVRDNIRMFPMSCTSGGVLDIYMEPHLPRQRLVLIGDSPVIVALSQLAPVLDYVVTQLDAADLSQVRIDERTCVLVATHGQYDEDALEQALRSPAAYIGMVGSRKRADACRDYLRTSGLTEQQVARLKAPAGLDVGAITPEEIAASILAELVQVRRRGLQGDVGADSSRPAPIDRPQGDVGARFMAPRGEAIPSIEEQSKSKDAKMAKTAETAIDPVCGMIVEIAGSRHHSTYEGREYYFCCPACKRLFERNPQEYLVQNER